jgi:5-methylthioadenosine/S-adenosylhomocysteine deaminase
MKTILDDALIVVNCDKNDIRKNLSMLIDEKGIIENIDGKDILKQANPTAKTISLKGKILFPGFINCHTHLTATLNRGILEDFTFPPSFPYPRSSNSLLSDEENQIMATLGVVEGIRSGTTTFLELGRNTNIYASSIIETGARFILGEMIQDVNYNVIQAGTVLKSKDDFSEKLREESLERAVRLYEEWNGKNGGKVQVIFSPATTDSCSPEMLKRTRDLSEKLNTVYTIHLSQSKQEIIGIKNAWNESPTEYLYKNEFLSSKLIAAHCRYVNENEINLLGKFSVGISNNPAIASRRGAAAPIRDLIDAGSQIGIGTDNMAEDMLEAARTGYFAERVRTNNELIPQPEEVFGWATTGGAKITDNSAELGSLEPGKNADLFVIDPRKAHLTPNLRTQSNLLNNGISSDIESLMVGGKWIMYEGEILNINEDQLLKDAQSISEKTWGNLKEQYPMIKMPVQLD